MSGNYLSNEDLSFVKPGIKGNLCFKGQFANGDTPDEDFFLKALKWLLSPNPRKKEKKLDKFTLQVQDGKSFLTESRSGIQWLGHATFLIRLNGKLFLTDPCLSSLPLFRRKTGLAYPAEDINGLDYLLLSHGHRDHLDHTSLNKILPQNPALEVLTSLKNGSLLKGKGIKKIQEAAWYQRYNTQGIEVVFLPARHWHRRGMNDFNKILWGSFALRTPECSIYFCGDSAYGSHFKEIGDLMGPFDYCLMPIGAYQPEYLMHRSHTHPEEAVQAFHDLKGKTFIPMHYGTYDLSDEPLGEPYRWIKRLESEGKIRGELRLLDIGSTCYL